MKTKSPLEQRKTELRSAIRYNLKRIREDSTFEANNSRERMVAELRAELRQIEEREKEHLLLCL